MQDNDTLACLWRDNGSLPLYTISSLYQSVFFTSVFLLVPSSSCTCVCFIFLLSLNTFTMAMVQWQWYNGNGTVVMVHVNSL